MTERRSSLAKGVRIERGTGADWAAMADLHYRGHHPGAATDFFRMVYDRLTRGEYTGGQTRTGQLPPVYSRGAKCVYSPGAERVGVIVYSRSPLSLAARNRATGGRYRLGRMGRVSIAALVNRELRIISRVVIAPNWRGLGLASRLVAETLGLVGTPYVEALAAMGQMHPFFERAGMTAYPGVPSREGERLRAFFDAAGIGEATLHSPALLGRAIENLQPAMQQMAEAETARWARSYLGAKNHKTNRPDRRRLLELVARHLGTAPTYYLWARQSST